MTKAKAPARREFIPALLESIVKGCPGSREETLAAVKKWSDGGKPNTPYEHGVFSVCDDLARRIDAQP